MPDTGSAAACMEQARALAERLVKVLSARGETLAGAESCTAGLASGAVAGIPGASKVFWGSFVTYTADAKSRMLGVPEELIRRHGAVSKAVALAMAEGALEQSGASWAFSVTGLAGPDGDGSGLPTGTVWVGLAGRAGGASPWSSAEGFLFSGPRNAVRVSAAAAALEAVLKKIEPE